MARAAELVNTVSSPDEALTSIMGLALETVGAERGFVVLIDPDTGGLAWRVASHFDGGAGRGDLGLSRTLVWRVHETQQPYFNMDVALDEQYRDVPSVREFGLRAIICVPLRVKARKVGVIYLDNRIRSGAFEPEDMDFVVAFSHQAAAVLDVAMVRDLQVTHATAAQQQQRAAVGHLAAGVAHEINNPLGTILMNAQLLAEDETRTEERESLQQIVAGAHQARHVVDRLLTWFRAGTDEERTAFDLVAAVRDVATLSGTEVEVRGPSTLTVRLNRPALAQILMALLDNARLAQPDDSVTVHVDPGFVRVEDHGPGIPASAVPHVFNPFFTTRPPGSGQGLGLFVARGLAEKMGGTVTVERTSPQGTVMRLTLPP